jgi:hypothetical protein
LVGQAAPDLLAQARSTVVTADARAQNLPDSSLNFENRWRWPVSYRSIEVLAVIIDIVIILSAGMLADAVYRLTTAELSSEITTYAAAAAVVAALFTSLLKGRGLYKPTVLLAWTSQVRAVTLTWIGVFMFLAGCVFALKIGDAFLAARSSLSPRSVSLVWSFIGRFGVQPSKPGWRAENGCRRSSPTRGGS